MHYANGREAKVGDPVVGTVYNTPGIVAGTLVSLTPGQDACSAQVAWTVVVPKGGPVPRMVAPVGPGVSMTTPYRTQGSEEHGMGGAQVDLYVCHDYTHAGALLHARDAAEQAFPKVAAGTGG